MHNIDLAVRPRRLRNNALIRKLVREINLTPKDLVMPLFIKEGLNEKQAIKSMPGQYQYSLREIGNIAKEIETLGIPAVLLFGIPKTKDEIGSACLQKDNIITQAIAEIKSRTKNLLVITDLCFCEYTSHGHCGVLNARSELDNDKTLIGLQQQALVQAKAGSDIIAPSGMVDGMVAAIRSELDKASFTQLPILSYAVKYQSSLYGPFREAAEGSPQFGDRSQYQMDIHNAQEAIKEAQLDIDQGADMIMCKPGLFYLDIVNQLRQAFPTMPLSAYQVSGEYAMIKAAANLGALDEKALVYESLVALKRAGCDFIISYFSIDAAKQFS